VAQADIRRKWMRARPRAVPTPSPRGRNRQGALPGPLAIVTTVPVIERVELDRHRFMEATFDGMRVVYDQPPPEGRLFVETQSAKPAWLIRWRVLPPSQNELMRRYADPHAYAKLIRGWQDVFWAAMAEVRIPQASGKRRMEIARYIREEKFRLDRGNLVGGCKPLLDAAVRAGLLLDDREEHLDDHYRQVLDATERTEILVYNT